MNCERVWVTGSNFGYPDRIYLSGGKFHGKVVHATDGRHYWYFYENHFDVQVSPIESECTVDKDNNSAKILTYKRNDLVESVFEFLEE